MSLYSAFVMICKRTAGMIPSIILPLPRFDIRLISRAIALLMGTFVVASEEQLILIYVDT
jgi:hypothetical protein